MRGRSPLKIVESMAAGVPVVTGDVGDRREMLGNGAAGVLVQPGNPEALANGMLTLLSDAALQTTLAQGARMQSRQFLWPALAEKWFSIYGK